MTLAFVKKSLISWQGRVKGNLRKGHVGDGVVEDFPQEWTPVVAYVSSASLLTRERYRRDWAWLSEYPVAGLCDRQNAWFGLRFEDVCCCANKEAQVPLAVCGKRNECPRAWSWSQIICEFCTEGINQSRRKSA